jgi:hypothetical protein
MDKGRIFMKGGLTLNFMLLLFCFLFSMYYFAGYQLGYQYIIGLNLTSETSFYLLATAIAGAFLGLTLGAGILSRLGGSSFSVIYIIPAMAFSAFAAVMLAPIGALVNSGLPSMFQILIMGVFYIMLFVIGFGFIRGMEV